MADPLAALPDYAAMDEDELVRHAQSGAGGAFRTIIQRGNRRLFRVARSILHDDAEAEDVVQETYARAFAKIGEFEARSSLQTWLTRIAIREAGGRLRRRREVVGLEVVEAAQETGAQVIPFPSVASGASPEAEASRLEIRRVLEGAIDELPRDFRLVFILRDVEDCSIAETASVLGIREETVKTRLHRARRQLRAALSERLASTLTDAFMFMGERCERTTETALARLRAAGLCD